MTIYVDSSTLVTAYLSDEADFAAARALLTNRDVPLMSGSLTPIEVAGALVRAARSGRGERDRLLALLWRDTTGDGPVTILSAPPEHVEERTMHIVCATGLKALDAWHIAAAEQLFDAVGTPGEPSVFATRDKQQGEVAASMGFEVI